MIVSLRATLSAHENERPLDIRNETMLKKLLTESGISAGDIYVTNVVKCAGPVKPAKAFKVNAKTCLQTHLKEETDAIQPDFFLFFGVTSASIINGLDIPITPDFPNKHFTYVTHSFEELYRHGIKYYNHALACMKDIKERL